MQRNDLKKMHEERARRQYQQEAAALLEELKPYATSVLENKLNELKALRKAFDSEYSYSIKANILAKYNLVYNIYFHSVEVAQQANQIIQNKYYEPLSINPELQAMVTMVEALVNNKDEFNSLSEFNVKAKLNLKFLANPYLFLNELTDLSSALIAFRKEFYDNFNKIEKIEEKLKQFVQEIRRLKTLFNTFDLFFDVSTLNTQFDIAIKLELLPDSLSELTISCDKNIIVPASDAIWNIKNICEKTTLSLDGKYPSINTQSITASEKDTVNHFAKQPLEIINLIFLEGMKKHENIESLLDYIINFEKTVGENKILLNPTKVYSPAIKLIVDQYLIKNNLVKITQLCFEKKSPTLLRILCLSVDNDVNKWMLGTNKPSAEKTQQEAYLKDTEILNQYKYLDGVLAFDFDSFLSLAIKANWLQGVKYLLALKANVNQPNYDTNYNKYCWGYGLEDRSEVRRDGNPLSIALEKKSGSINTLIIKLLLQAGANLNATTGNFNTPLHLACKNGKDLAIVTMLATANSNVINLQNGSGETPLCFASKYEVAKYLIQYTRDLSHAKIKTILHNINFIEKLQEYIKPGQDVSVVDNFFSEHAPVTTGEFFNSSIRTKQIAIVKSFVDYLKNHVNTSSDIVMKYFIERYQKEHNNNENPFTTLSEPIYSGPFNFFNLKENAFGNLFTEYFATSPDRNSFLYKPQELLPFQRG